MSLHQKFILQIAVIQPINFDLKLSKSLWDVVIHINLNVILILVINKKKREPSAIFAFL